MEASSAIPVILLDIHPQDKILDMCCARGMKLMLAAEIMQMKQFDTSNSTIDESDNNVEIHSGSGNGNDDTKINKHQGLIIGND